MKFIVAQIGARRGYAVPAILEKAGMLERFYTDITGDVALGRFFSAVGALPFLGQSPRRLMGRRLPRHIRAKGSCGLRTGPMPTRKGRPSALPV